jgi:hypothetical protein
VEDPLRPGVGERPPDGFGIEQVKRGTRRCDDRDAQLGQMPD